MKREIYGKPVVEGMGKYSRRYIEDFETRSGKNLSERLSGRRGRDDRPKEEDSKRKVLESRHIRKNRNQKVYVE
jgi:hypothetical protein